MAAEDLGKRPESKVSPNHHWGSLEFCPSVWPGLFFFFNAPLNQLAFSQKAAEKLDVQLSADKKSTQRRFLFLVKKSEMGTLLKIIEQVNSLLFSILSSPNPQAIL